MRPAMLPAVCLSGLRIHKPRTAFSYEERGLSCGSIALSCLSITEKAGLMKVVGGVASLASLSQTILHSEE